MINSQLESRPFTIKKNQPESSKAAKICSDCQTPGNFAIMCPDNPHRKQSWGKCSLDGYSKNKCWSKENERENSSDARLQDAVNVFIAEKISQANVRKRVGEGGIYQKTLFTLWND